LTASNAIIIYSEQKSNPRESLEGRTASERGRRSHNSWVNQTLEAAAVLESHVDSAGNPGVRLKRKAKNCFSRTVRRCSNVQRRSVKQDK
jgi:hypothetical protein